MKELSIDQLCVNKIRRLAMDAVQKANSGHCPSATFDAGVLAAAPRRRQGGRSGLRRLGELSVTLDGMKRFRQLDSNARGRWTSGIETTTGPLGQGVATQRGHG